MHNAFVSCVLLYVLRYSSQISFPFAPVVRLNIERACMLIRKWQKAIDAFRNDVLYLYGLVSKLPTLWTLCQSVNIGLSLI